MKTRKSGKRYRLLIYQRVMDRLWAATLVLGCVVVAIWWWGGTIFILLPEPFSTLLLAGGIVLVTLGFLMYLMRSMAYVQACTDHLRVSTPFIRLRVSYRRIRTAHPVEFHHLFPPSKASWADRRLLEPFYGKTVLVVELSEFPLRRSLLNLFLPRVMFSTQAKGLVLVVKDWMALSTEIESYMGVWLQKATPVPRSPYLSRP
jgi:hypothetical protein